MLFSCLTYLYGLELMVLHLTVSILNIQIVYFALSVHMISVNFMKVAMTYHNI